MEKNKEVCCVGVVEVIVSSTQNRDKRWVLSCGFGCKKYTEETGINLQKNAAKLVQAAVAADPERYGFAKGEQIEYRTGINILCCNELIGVEKKE